MAQIKKPTLPTPTYWIEHKVEGSPPPDTLLFILGYTDEEEPSSCMDLGYWSEKLSTFIDLAGGAIEERCTVSHYHIVHTPTGNPFLL